MNSEAVMVECKNVQGVSVCVYGKECLPQTLFYP